MATHVRKLNRYWSTMSATSCMSRWCRWFCQSLQYLGYLQCLSYLQRLRCLFKHPLSVSLYVQPNQVNISFSRELRTTSAVTIYIWSCETARNKSDSPKTHICDGCYNHRTGYNHQVSTSWFDNSFSCNQFCFFLCWVISPGYIWIIVQLILWAKCCWSCKAFLYPWDLKN